MLVKLCEFFIDVVCDLIYYVPKGPDSNFEKDMIRIYCGSIDYRRSFAITYPYVLRRVFDSIDRDETFMVESRVDRMKAISALCDPDLASTRLATIEVLTDVNMEELTNISDEKDQKKYLSSVINYTALLQQCSDRVLTVAYYTYEAVLELRKCRKHYRRQ